MSQQALDWADDFSRGSGSIPLIRTAADMPVCCGLGQDHPEMRWYIEKRAEALGLPQPRWEGMVLL